LAEHGCVLNASLGLAGLGGAVGVALGLAKDELSVASLRGLVETVWTADKVLGAAKAK
jgi:hypothetical protein